MPGRLFLWGLGRSSVLDLQFKALSFFFSFLISYGCWLIKLWRPQIRATEITILLFFLDSNFKITFVKIAKLHLNKLWDNLTHWHYVSYQISFKISLNFKHVKVSLLPFSHLNTDIISLGDKTFLSFTSFSQCWTVYIVTGWRRGLQRGSRKFC